MVTLKNYGGYSASRYLKAEISYSSGTSLSWKMTVMSGSSDFYSTGPTTLYINNKLVSETARLSSSNYIGTSKKAFPVGPAGQYIEGTYNVGTYGNIPISFSTAIYNTTQETQTGSIDIYKISYNANGGSGTNPGTHYTSSGIATTIKSNTFTKAGYTFAGWTTNSNGTNDGYGWTNWSGSWGNWNGTYGISNYTLTLYARWTPNTYTVKYNGNGNTGGSTANSTHTYDTSKALTSNGFTKTGYTFKNWNTKTDGSGTSYTNGASVKNLTTTNGDTVNLYAQWTANSVRITYWKNGGTIGSADYEDNGHGHIKRKSDNNIYFHTMSYNSSGDPYDALTFGLTKTGYTFAQWKVRSSGAILDQNTSYASTNYAQYDDSTKTTANTTLVTCYLDAQWTKNTYTNTIYHYQYFGPNNNGANGYGWKLKETSTFTASYGDTVTIPSSQVKNYSGYSNSGTAGSGFFATSGETWGTKAIGSGTFIQPAYGIGIEYYYYPLYYIDLNLYVNGSRATENSNIMTADIYINNSRVSNDVADYWTQHPSKTTYSIQDIKVGSNYVLLDVTGSSGIVELSDLACTVYVGQKYTVTYKSNYSGGPADQTQAINYGTVWTTKSSSTFSRTGYTFSGWNTAENGSGTSYTASTNQSNSTASNITLYAQWTANTGSLFFNANYNSIGQNLLDFTKFTNGTQNNINYSYDATTGILTLNGTSNNGQIDTIHWLDCNIPTNTYYTISGEVVSGSMENGRFVVEMPVASGAERQKLDLFNTNYGVSYLSSTNINSIRLWAWQNNSGILKFNNYKIKLKIEFGIHYEDFVWTPNAKTISYNSSYGPLVNITRLGYKFNGWYTATSGGAQVTNSTIQTSTGNTILYAQWEPWGVVRIYTDKGWQLAVPYIYDNGWKQTFPYIYDNGWKECH